MEGLRLLKGPIQDLEGVVNLSFLNREREA